MADPDSSDLIQQLGQAWQAAQRQLAELRDQVDKAAALAQAKVESNLIERDRDKALTELGARVWALVRDGRLTLPPALGAALAAVEEAQRRQEAQTADITQLLLEPELPQTRPSKSGVAPRGKKR